MRQEKRRVQRVVLEKPIEGALHKQPVTIIDLSTTGARVEHPTPMSGRKQFDLRFLSGEEEFLVRCELVRSRLQRSARDRSAIVYCSGLRFVEPTEELRASIRTLVATLVERQQARPSALSVAV